MFKIFDNYSHTGKLIIASGIIGNLLETFDVMICAFLAPILAKTFFSTQYSLVNDLIFTFNIFLVGYLSRPIGSLFIGLFSDQLGRKKMLIFSITMVGICTAMIAFIPSFQSIGIAAAIFFLLLRILQNVCIGGEYINSIAYLIESAKKTHRGFYGCWVSVGFNMGTLLAAVLVFITVCLINKHIIPEWSWRVIFFLAIMGTSIGIWIRKSLPESLGFILEKMRTKPLKKFEILKESLKFIKIYRYKSFAVFTIAWLGVSETSAIFIYSPIHMITVNHFSQQTALGINCASLILLVILVPLFGLLSDYFSRVKLLIIASVFFLLFSLPYFLVLTYGNYIQIILLKLLFSIPSACFYAVAPVLIAETFPIKLRCTSLAFIYQIAASLAAGFSPLIMLHLAHNTSIPYSPAYFLMGSTIFCLIGLSLIKNNATDSEK